MSIIQNLEVINIQSERITFFKSDGLNMASPIRDPESYYFSGKYISRKKTSALRYYTNYNHNFEFMMGRCVVGSGGGVRGINVVLRLSTKF